MLFIILILITILISTDMNCNQTKSMQFLTGCQEGHAKEGIFIKLVEIFAIPQSKKEIRIFTE